MRTSPLADLTYDVLTVLHHKAKGLEAYAKYIRDAEDDDELQELFVALRRQDEENVRILTEALARRLDDELGYEAEGADEEDEEDDDLWDEDDEDDDVEVEDPGETTSRGS